MLGIVRELLSIEDLDELLRAGVELPRLHLGVERCALWLLNVDGVNFRGTWGTDIHGQTSDERQHTCSVEDLEKTLSKPFQSMEGWILRGDTQQTWTPDGNRIEGCGWNTIIPLTGPEGNVGAFFQDAAITNASLDPHQQDLMTLYCSILGQLAARRLAEKREFFLSHGLEEVLVAADELMSYDDLDLLHRGIVELARKRLGVVRCGLFVADPARGETIYSGTWGTDWDGNTTDEHRGQIDIRNRDIELAKPGMTEVASRRWRVMQPFRMSWFEPDGTRIDNTKGWNALHPLAIQDRILGYLCSDPGKSGDALDPRKMELLSSYCDLAARILDRFQTQAGLREAMVAAEQATRAKSDFLAAMSHEIRTPMAGVLGMLRLAQKDRTMSGSTRALLGKALGNAESLLNILNDILDYSKIEAGKLTLETIDFPLRSVVDEALAAFPDMAANKELSFSVVVDDRLPGHLRGDPTRLRQILSNLATNALKFTESGAIEVRVQPRGWNGNVCTVRFSVSDTGIGIPPEILPRLFAKFEQADMSTTRKFGGTGLGLSICRQLVDAMGGTIEAASTPGAGSTFVVEIPFERGSETPQAPSPEQRPHSHRLRVLCAEDYPTTQIVVRALLEDRGHLVDIVDNGLDALERLASHDYDVALLDGRMPLMDGLETIRHLRSGSMGTLVFRDPGLFAIAFTANVSESDKQRFLEAGTDDFLGKPIDEAEFHRALENAIATLLERGKDLPPLVHATPSALDDLFGVDATGDGSRSSFPCPGLANAPPQGRTPQPLESRLEDIFRSTLPERLRELQASFQRGDLPEMARQFHGLRGSAGCVKAHDLVAMGRELEALADLEDMDAIRQRMPRFLSALESWLPVAPKDIP